ncbi:MAG: hypothetical protein NC039_07060 [Muribaculaceae bacterium]|nr:hypothetical protein [Muribaculaceae bacterium]
MKKIILGTTILLSSLFAGQAFAQTTAAQDAACPANQEQTCNLPTCPFDGLNLTAEQQAQLKEISPCTKDKTDKKDKKEAREERRKARETARKDYLNKVKAILTPEQYVQFLENNYVQQAPKHQVRPDGKGNGHRPDGKARMERTGKKMERKAQTSVAREQMK